MRPIATFFLLAGLCHAGSVMAEPCVTATFDVPLWGAENVVTKQVDVPSPQFPGLWQEGSIDGFFYTLYANSEGILRPSRNSTEWQIAIKCEIGSENCAMTETGSPSVDGMQTAARIAACLRGEVMPAPEETPAPAIEIAPAPPELCGKAAIPDGAAGITLQRLLVLAGGDPGPIDGYPGELTQTALVAVLGKDARTLDIAKAVAAMDDYLCKQ